MPVREMDQTGRALVDTAISSFRLCRIMSRSLSARSTSWGLEYELFSKLGISKTIKNKKAK